MGVPDTYTVQERPFFHFRSGNVQAAFTLSGKIFLFTKKNTTIEMPPLSTVVPML